MTKELTYEQETVRSVFGAYINDLKAYSSKPDRPTFRKLEEVRDKAIKALEAQPSEDCISREQAKKFLYEEIEQLHDDGLYDCFSRIIDDMYNELPPVTPKYTDEEIDKAQAVEQAYVDKMVELAVEETKRPKGKWIEVEVRNVYATLKCSVCGRVIEPIFDFCKYSYEDIKRSYPYCHCGAEMGGGKDETNN